MKGISAKHPEKCPLCNERPARVRSHYKGLTAWVCRICAMKTETLKAKQALKQ